MPKSALCSYVRRVPTTSSMPERPNIWRVKHRHNYRPSGSKKPLIHPQILYIIALSAGQNKQTVDWIKRNTDS